MVPIDSGMKCDDKNKLNLESTGAKNEQQFYYNYVFGKNGNQVLAVFSFKDPISREKVLQLSNISIKLVLALGVT